MTHASIELGRALDAVPKSFVAVTAANTQITTGDGNRIGVALSVNWGAGTVVTDTLVVGPLVGGIVVPVLALNPNEPSGYLSVDKLGSIVTGPLFYVAVLTGAAILGVTCMRPIQSWGQS